MTYNFTKWGSYHKQLAKEYGQKSIKTNTLPTDIFEWIEAARPKVEGKKRSFLAAPYWIPIYNDPHNYQMIMGGRQIYKSTACTDFIAFTATTQPGIQVCYVTYDQKNLSGFSKQKLRVGTFLTNSVLHKILRHPGNIGEVSLKNDSTIYLVTSNYQYRHLEGKSPELCIIDEAQYQDMRYFGRVHQTMMATKGKVKIFGIGGEAGSDYEKLWNETNQMEWIYDDPEWKEKLRFDEKGMVVEEYLIDVLKGRWVPQNPSAEMFHGYHIPQTIVPGIPWTEEEAIYKYKTHPRFSIEGQKKILTSSEYTSHVMGSFYNSSHRPVTKKMVLECTQPYTYLSLLRHDEIRNIKKTFGEDATVAMGVDFGSGSSSSTVISVLILWHKSERIQVAFLEKRPRENQMMQAQYINELFKLCSCDIGIGDLGYNPDYVKLIQDGGYSQDTGERFDGVSRSKFWGCRTISDITKPVQTHYDKVDEHGDRVGRVEIDKTYSIDSLIETMQSISRHPKLNNNETRRTKLIIPMKYDYQVNFFLNDLNNITRKDIQILEKSGPDPRQHPRKLYNHPPDSVMAVIYAITAFKVKESVSWYYISA